MRCRALPRPSKNAVVVPFEHRCLADSGRLLTEFVALEGMSHEQRLQHMVLGLGSVVNGSVVEPFLLKLERLSMELQRTNPQEWNRCIHVAVRCLSGTLRMDRAYYRFRL